MSDNWRDGSMGIGVAAPWLSRYNIWLWFWRDRADSQPGCVRGMRDGA